MQRLALINFIAVVLVVIKLLVFIKIVVFVMLVVNELGIYVGFGYFVGDFIAVLDPETADCAGLRHHKAVDGVFLELASCEEVLGICHNYNY